MAMQMKAGGEQGQAERDEYGPVIRFGDMLTTPRRVCAWPGNRTFEDFTVRTAVAPDGRHATRTSVEGFMGVFALTDAGAIPATGHGNPLVHTIFGPGGAVMRLPWAEPGAQWTLNRDGREIVMDIPAGRQPLMAPDGVTIASWERNGVFRLDDPPAEIWLGSAGAQRRHELPGPVMGLAFAPDSRGVYALVRQPTGASSLLHIDAATGTWQALARNLDTVPYPNGFAALGATATHVYFSAVGRRVPDDRVRQQPVAARWLRLLRLELATGAIETVAHTAGDLCDIAVQGDELHFIHSVVDPAVMVVPRDGGTAQEFISGGFLPEWSPDGRRIAYTWGEFRMADWGLCLDALVARVDGDGRRVGTPSLLVAGAHEDFTPTWSPDGRWIAYHTHRPTCGDVPFYGAPGMRDTIFVRAAEDPEAPEIDVTSDAWEIAWGRWSPDGRSILYQSWDRNGQPGIYSLYRVDIDPLTGRALKQVRLPNPPGVISPALPAWSPDGREIVVEDMSGPDTRALWIIAADGSRGRKLHAYRAHTLGGVDWSPDGSTIAFSALDGDCMQLHAIPTAGGPARRLTTGQGNLMQPRYSPDGRWIACSRLDTTQTLWRATLR